MSSKTPLPFSPETPTTSTSSTPIISKQQCITLKPCSHLSQVLNSNAKDTVIRNYGLAAKVSSFNTISSLNMPSFVNIKGNKSKVDRHKILKLKTRAVKCRDCSTNLGNTFMCLQCPHVGCWHKHHFIKHAKLAGHIFGIDGQLGYLFCFKCGDYTNDPQLEAVRLNMIGNHNNELQPTDNQTEEDDEKLITEYSRPTTFKATTGLRGFVNMGSTCFMSSVLQTFIHNPIIREFFMTEGHMDCSKQKNECITCCVDEIFTDFYTTNKTSGFGPTSLLNAAWKTNKSLAGYSEQDAHEFWQFLVNQLHHDLTGANNHNSSSCDCVVHKAFSSDLQSAITCLECGNVTKTIDPIIDLSLEISDNSGLIDCLGNFTKSENLDIKYSCSNCQTRTNATKKLTILKFPNVLSIQLKRFKHNNQSVKIESFIEFPMFINMSEFATNYEVDKKQNPYLNYELFGVVCHIGSVNTGHYVTVIKNNEGKWFKFDDSVVTLMTWDQVSQLKAYMLFYMIHKL